MSGDTTWDPWRLVSVCTVSVKLEVVEDHELPVPWVACRREDGGRLLIVRESATPKQVARGYQYALFSCPVRIALERAA